MLPEKYIEKFVHREILLDFDTIKIISVELFSVFETFIFVFFCFPF